MEDDTLYQQGNTLLKSEDPEQGDYWPLYNHIRKIGPSSFNAKSASPIFKFLFDLHGIEVYTENDLVNFDKVTSRMLHMCKCFYSNFFSTERFRPWLKINNLFFQQAFFNNYVYVEWVAEEEKYNLYLRVSGNRYTGQGPHRFVNVQTGVNYEFDDWEEKLVEFNLVGLDEDRYRDWFYMAYESEVRLCILRKKFMHFGIAGVLDVSNYEGDVQAFVANFEQELINHRSILIKKENQDRFKILENPLITAADYDTMLTAHYKWYDRELSELGRVANLNPKKERSTSGETYMAVDQHIDYLRSVQENLDEMTEKMNELGWPPLSFKVNAEADLGLLEASPGGQSGGGEVPKQAPNAGDAPM